MCIALKAEWAVEPLTLIGATVTVRTPAGAQMTRVVTGDSFSAQHPTTVHFGLGKREQVDQIEIRWPSGIRQVIENPAINTLHKFVEPDSTATKQ